MIELNREETTDLVTKCREKGVTIVSAMTGAFLASAEDILGPFPQKDRLVAVPFDLRRHLGMKSDYFCFFVGGFQFNFTYDRKKPFWKNVQNLSAIIKKRVKRLDNSSPLMGMEAFDATFLDAFLGYANYSLLAPASLEQTENLRKFADDSNNVAWKLARDMGRKMGGTMVTNLGRVDFPETYGNLKLDQIFVAPCAAETVPLILAGAGVSGKLSYTANYVEREDGTSRIKTEDMIQIRNHVLEYLGFWYKVSNKPMN